MIDSILRRVAVGFMLVAAAGCEVTTGPDDGTTRSGFSLLIERRNAGQRSFYIMSADGNRFTPFTGVPTGVVTLMPSPDGKIIAFIREVDGVRELWAMDRDGANQRIILAGGPYQIESASWAPDSRKLAVAYSTPTATSDIATIGVDGTGFKDLTPDPLPGVIIDRDPSWSPDGTRIAYSSNASGTRRLWIMNADGSGAHQVLASSVQSSERNPVWAPDTTNFLAVISTTPGGTGVAFVRADGTDFKHVPIPAGPTDLAWLPDGRLIYISNQNGDYDVWTVDRATGGTVQVTSRHDDDVKAVVLRDVDPFEWLGFEAAVTYQINRPLAIGMAIADVITDGRPDVMVLSPILNNEIRIMKGTASGALQSVGALFADSDVAVLRIGNVSNDVAPDIVGRGDSVAYFWRGRVDGPGIATQIPMKGALRDLAVVDLDGNGRADIVSLVEVANQPFHLKRHTVNTTDNFVLAGDLATTRTNGHSICAGDITGDGWPDVAVFAGSANLSAFIAEGHGDLTLSDPASAGTNLTTDLQAAAGCGDFNNDGKDDVALFSPGQGVSIHRVSSGAFGAAVRITASANAVAYADVDRDGDLDIVMASSNTAAVIIAKNRGTGTFDAPVAYTITTIPISLTVGDLNGDNWPDVAVVDVQGGLVVLMSKGRNR